MIIIIFVVATDFAFAKTEIVCSANWTILGFALRFSIDAAVPWLFTTAFAYYEVPLFRGCIATWRNICSAAAAFDSAHCCFCSSALADHPPLGGNRSLGGGKENRTMR